jgi:hypothetical protein
MKTTGKVAARERKLGGQGVKSSLKTHTILKRILDRVNPLILGRLFLAFAVVLWVIRRIYGGC